MPHLPGAEKLKLKPKGALDLFPGDGLLAALHVDKVEGEEGRKERKEGGMGGGKENTSSAYKASDFTIKSLPSRPNLSLPPKLHL